MSKVVIAKVSTLVAEDFLINPVPSLPCRNEYLTIVLKNYAKADVKIFCYCLIFLDFLKFLAKYFV